MRHNLPIELTSFIGRERELEEVRRLAHTTRLLMLTGAGGCGRARLALHAAAEMVEEHRDGIRLVDLAPLTDAALVPGAIAQVLGVREEPGRDLADTLVDALDPRAPLLILDN